MIPQLVLFLIFLQPVDTVQQERDEIFMLAAYSVVYQNWQTPADRPGRGHNIGSILVNDKGEPVYAERNCNAMFKDTTQHGEVRLIMGFLEKTHQGTLKGFTVYTSLEPCAMCSGMMTMAEVKRCVYGQTDPDYGKALERLEFDGARKGGWKPYPRPVKSEPSALQFRKDLDKAYGSQHDLTQWLRTDQAKEIFKKADDRLKNYHIQNYVNSKALFKAKAVAGSPGE